jgi:hypothetical protein
MVLTDKVFRVSYFTTVALTEDDIVLYLENYMRDVKKSFASHVSYYTLPCSSQFPRPRKNG